MEAVQKELLQRLKELSEPFKGPARPPYTDYQAATREFEQLSAEFVGTYAEKVNKDVQLSGSPPGRRSTVFSLCSGEIQKLWVLEARMFLPMGASGLHMGRVRELWGIYQPSIQSGTIDGILFLTPYELPERALTEIARFEQMVHSTVAGLPTLLRRLRSDCEAAALLERTKIQPVPLQGAGPHFELSPDGRVELIVRRDSDPSGNHLDRIAQLLPLVRRSADLALNHVARTDAYPALKRTLEDYISATSGDDSSLQWGLIYGLGVILDNTAASVQREISDRLGPSLEDEAEAALNSLRALHGSLILATREGRELQEQADRLIMTRVEQIQFQEDAEIIATELRNNPAIIGEEAAKVVLDAGRSVGEGRYPERGSVFGITTVKHVSTVVVSAAVLASMIPAGALYLGAPGGFAAAGAAWVGFEALKKTKIYASAVSALGSGFDSVNELDMGEAIKKLYKLESFRLFVKRNEAVLRRMALRTRPLEWMTPYLDSIIRTEVLADEKLQDCAPRNSNIPLQ